MRPGSASRPSSHRPGFRIHPLSRSPVSATARWNSTRPTRAKAPRPFSAFQLQQRGFFDFARKYHRLAVTTLVALSEDLATLIGSLLTVTLETQTEGEQSSEGATAQVASAGPGAAGQALLGRGGSSDDPDDLGGDSALLPTENLPFTTSWARFVTGVDQAIEALRNEADARLRQEQEPAKSDAMPGAPRPASSEKTTVPARIETTTAIELAAIHRIEAQRDRFHAIDLAVSSWEAESSPRSQPRLSHASPAAMSTTPLTVAQIVETAVRKAPWRGLETDRLEARAVPASRLATLLAISATAMTAREILLSRAGLHRRRPVARTRATADTRD